MLIYIHNKSVYKFVKNNIFFTKVGDVSTNKTYLFKQYNNYRCIIKPYYTVNSLLIFNYLRTKKKKSITFDIPKYNEFLTEYCKFISDTFLEDFYFYFFKKTNFSDSLFLVADEVKRMHIPPSLFLYYCFDNSVDILIPHPGRMKMLLSSFDIYYKPKRKLIIDNIEHVIGNAIDSINCECGEDVFSFMVDTKINPFLICFHPKTWKMMWEGKMFDDIIYWKEILACFVILKDYKQLKDEIIECGWYGFLKERDPGNF